MSNPIRLSDSLDPHLYRLVQSVYREFEKLHEVCGESNCAALLSLNLRMLEDLDRLASDRQQFTTLVKSLNTEKKDLIFQLEREKKLHNTTALRLSSVEDQLFAHRKESDGKIEKLEGLLRQRDILTKTTQDHATRLEDQICHMQTEITSLQERYNEILKAYVDQMERPKSGDSKHCVSLPLTEMQPAVEIYGNPLKSGMPDGNSFQLVTTENPKDLTASFIDLMDSENLDFESVLNSDQEKEDEEVAENAGRSEDSVMMREVGKLIQENQDLCATKNALNVVKNDLIQKLEDVTGEKLMLIKEVEHLRHRQGQSKIETSQLHRQLAEYRTAITQLQTRLKLYEDVEDFVSTDCLPSLQHAQSCAVLNEIPASKSLLKCSNNFGGSLDRLPNGSVHVNVLTDNKAAQLNQPKNIACTDRKVDDNDDPYFTRKEMARIIAERNHYKQSLLELQDTVRYTTSLQAQKSAKPPTARFTDVLFSGLRSMAGDFATGIHELFTEVEPLALPDVPHEATQLSFDVSRNQDEDSEPEASNFSIKLRQMFSHLIGHAAGQGTEAFFGTGNDFSADLASQSFKYALLQSINQANTISRPSQG